MFYPTSKAEVRFAFGALIVIMLIFMALAMKNCVERSNSSTPAVNDPTKCESHLSQCRKELDQCESQLEDSQDELTKCNAGADAPSE